MVIYYGIFFILVILAFIEVLGIKIKKHFALLIIILFFLLAAFRWEIGTDWESYLSNFRIANDMGLIEYIKVFSGFYEYGYVILTGIIGFLTNNYNFYLSFVALIIFILTYSRLFSRSKLIYISLLAIFCFSFAYMFSVPRQGIAIAVVFYSIKYIEEKSKFKFIIAVLIATMFHSSALIFLPAYFIFYLKISVKKYLIGMFLALFCGIAAVEILSFINNMGILPGKISERISSYLTTKYVDNASRALIVDILIKTLTRGFVIVLIFLFLLKIKNKDENLNGYINFYYVSTYLYIISFFTSEVFSRLSIYYEEVQYILYSYVFFFAKKNIRILLFFVFVVFLFLKLYARLNSGYMEEFIPYKSILNL